MGWVFGIVLDSSNVNVNVFESETVIRLQPTLGGLAFALKS